MGELIEPGTRCLGHTNCPCQQAHHNVAFDAVADRARKRAHQEGYTGCSAGGGQGVLQDSKRWEPVSVGRQKAKPGF